MRQTLYGTPNRAIYTKVYLKGIKHLSIFFLSTMLLSCAETKVLEPEKVDVATSVTPESKRIPNILEYYFNFWSNNQRALDSSGTTGSVNYFEKKYNTCALAPQVTTSSVYRIHDRRCQGCGGSRIDATTDNKLTQCTHQDLKVDDPRNASKMSMNKKSERINSTNNREPMINGGIARERKKDLAHTGIDQSTKGIQANLTKPRDVFVDQVHITPDEFQLTTSGMLSKEKSQSSHSFKRFNHTQHDSNSRFPRVAEVETRGMSRNRHPVSPHTMMAPQARADAHQPAIGSSTYLKPTYKANASGNAFQTLNKVKYLMHGGAVTNEELKQASDINGNILDVELVNLIKNWIQSKEYQAKKRSFISFALDRKPKKGFVSSFFSRFKQILGINSQSEDSSNQKIEHLTSKDWVLSLCGWSSGSVCDASDQRLIHLVQEYDRSKGNVDELFQLFFSSTMTNDMFVARKIKSSQGLVSLVNTSHYCHAMKTRLNDIRKSVKMSPTESAFSVCDSSVKPGFLFGYVNKRPNGLEDGTDSILVDDNSSALSLFKVCSEHVDELLENEDESLLKVVSSKKMLDHYTSHLLGIPKNANIYRRTRAALGAIHRVQMVNNSCNNSDELTRALYDQASECGLGFDESESLKSIWLLVCQLPHYAS